MFLLSLRRMLKLLASNGLCRQVGHTQWSQGLKDLKIWSLNLCGSTWPFCLLVMAPVRVNAVYVLM